MGQKCCRPALRTNFPIHIVILNDIFYEANAIQDQHLSQIHDIDTKQISLKINKKGYIKKLCDYLSSHHHYICDTIRMIFLQIKNKKNPYSLAVASETSFRIVMMTQEINTEATEEEDHKTIPKSTILKFYQEFQQNVFDLALELLQQYLNISQHVSGCLDDIVENVLEMVRYLTLEQICTKLNHHTIKRTLDSVVDVINSKNVHKKVGLEVYRKIIQKYNFIIVGANVYRDIVKEHLWKFLAFWVREISQKVRESQKSKLSKQTKSREQIESMVDNLLLEGIFIQFFNSIFSYQESQYIYKELMLVYDSLSFGHVLIDIEGLVFSSLSRFQLKEQFLYRWFDYILNYLAVTQDYYQSIWKISGFQYPYTFIKKKHKNILKEENAVGCLQTVRRWVEGGQIDIATVLQYKTQKLLMSILLNLSNNDPHSQILNETCLTIEYLVNQHYLFYIELVSHLMTIIRQLQTEYNSGNKNCSKYLDQLIKVISALNPQKCLSVFEFEIQKLEQYERLYDIIFEPIQPSSVNKYLIKATTEILQKIGVISEANYDEKLCTYLGSIAKLLQEEQNIQSIFPQLYKLFSSLRKSSPYVLKPYINYLMQLYEKVPNSNIFNLIFLIYELLETTKNVEKVLSFKSAKNYQEKVLCQTKKIGKMKDMKSQGIYKLLLNLNMESPDIILEDVERNSFVASLCGTSSVGHSDHNFADVIVTIQKL